jgi:hypothetical protein
MMHRSRLMRRIAVVTVLVALALAVAAASPGDAGSSQTSAEAIVADMIARDPFGYGGAEARVVMLLVNQRGQQRSRTALMRSRRDGAVRRSFVRFLDPVDIAGTSFLGIDDDGDRVQHLYLPALAKTRRISSSQRNASFVGTDYSFADLDLRDVEDSTKRQLADEQVGGRDCFVIEAAPTDAASDYGKVVLWIGKDSLLPLRIRMFDRDGDELKRFSARELRQVNRRWIIAESKLVNLKRQHSTIIKVVDIDIRTDLPLEGFTVRALERG